MAQDITATEGQAEIAELDALDEKAVNEHAAMAAARAGSIDITLNAVGILRVQGRPFGELSYKDYAHPHATQEAVVTSHTREVFTSFAK